MKLKETGAPQLVSAMVLCYEKLRDKLEKICDVESYFGVIALKDGIVQSVSLNELGECDNLAPFCAQCAYIYKNARYNIFYGMNNCSIINTFGRVHKEGGAYKYEDIMYAPAFKPKMMNFNLVEGYRDFISVNQRAYPYEYIFNVMNIDEFRLIDAYNITETEHISRVFERIEDFAGLYFIRIMEAMQSGEFISKLELEQNEENELFTQRRKMSSAVRLNLAFNSFCKGNYRAASKKFHSLKNILTEYEKRRLRYMDSVLGDGKKPSVESDIFNYVEKSKTIARNEATYAACSLLLAFPVTFLASLSVFLFVKNIYFSSFIEYKARLVLQPENIFYFILALLMGTVLLFPGTNIAMRVFFKDRHDKQYIQSSIYINRLRLWPDGAARYFFNAIVILIFIGFALLLNNNSVFFHDKMAISTGSFRGINKNIIYYSEIEDIYVVTRIRREDRIYDDWKMYYLHLKDIGIVRAENIFTSKREFMDKGLPMIVNAIKKQPVEVGFFEEIFDYMYPIEDII